jgi:exoribonuclease R
VTAPLRRLADRYATEVCLALFAGLPVPDWVREALPKLPDVMTATDRIANAAERGAVDLTEAVLLQGREGERFAAAVLDVDEPKPDHGGPNPGAATPSPVREARGTVALDSPAVKARCHGDGMRLGERLEVALVTADPVRRAVMFQTVVPEK